LEKIFEVWLFSNKSDNLLKDYVRDFMKIKLETSTWKNDYKSIGKYLYIDTIK
jgi:hypothetical protein